MMMTRMELHAVIKRALGGTLAEEIVYGDIANGATSDLDTANRIARSMVTELGMSRLGRIFHRENSDSPFLAGGGFGGGRNYSEQTAREIDLEVRQLISDAVSEVLDILNSRRAALDALAERLFEKETIDGEEVRAIIEAHYPGPKLVPGTLAAHPTPAHSAAAHPAIRPATTAADDVRLADGAG
jgi:cell division protease FtsH